MPQVRDTAEPFESRVFRSDEGQVEYDVKLIKGATPQRVAVEGFVLRPDGKPLAGAEVGLTYRMAAQSRPYTIQIENGQIQRTPDQPIVTTDAEGRYELTELAAGR